eukprot:6474238-Prymnesium_polylepis.1
MSRAQVSRSVTRRYSLSEGGCRLDETEYSFWYAGGSIASSSSYFSTQEHDAEPSHLSLATALVS